MQEMFELFSPPERVRGKVAGPRRRAPLVARKGLVIGLHESSLLFFDDSAAPREVFLPYSQIADWWFTADGSKRDLRLVDLQPNDFVTVVIPQWLAKREKLL